MQHLLDDVEHFAKIVSGCESINNLVNNGVALDTNGRYAQSVLRLHAQDDLGSIAGNESLLSGIKKGAKKVKEWILELIKAIKNYVTGAHKKSKDFEADYRALKAKHTQAQSKAKSAPPEKSKKTEEWEEIFDNSAKGFDGPLKEILTRFNEMEKTVSGDGFKTIGYSPSFGNVKPGIERAIELAESDKPDPWFIQNSITVAMNKMTAEINAVEKKLAAWNQKTDEKDVGGSNIGTEVSKGVTQMGAINNGLTTLLERLKVNMTKSLDSFMAS